MSRFAKSDTKFENYLYQLDLFKEAKNNKMILTLLDSKCGNLFFKTILNQYFGVAKEVEGFDQPFLIASYANIMAEKSKQVGELMEQF